jgi:hypothetical protein
MTPEHHQLAGWPGARLLRITTTRASMVLVVGKRQGSDRCPSLDRGRRAMSKAGRCDAIAPGANRPAPQVPSDENGVARVA